MNFIKKKLQAFWPAWMLTLILFRPSKFKLDFLYPFIDYYLFLKSIGSYVSLIKKSKVKCEVTDKSLLIVVGRGMNIQWVQIWVILGSWIGMNGFRVIAITSRKKPIQNLYLRIFAFKLIFLDDSDIDDIDLPHDLSVDFSQLKTFRDFKEYEYMGIPLGKMALSTFSRQRATGIMDVNDQKSRSEVCYWLAYLYRVLIFSENLYEHEKISMLFFTEVFMEEYGSLYYAALNKNLNIIRFAGTVRDNAVVIQRLTSESDRTHFSSIGANNWQTIIGYPNSVRMNEELDQNFKDRYGDCWSLSKRNQLHTSIMSLDQARKHLGLIEGQKVAVIYSHILYDTLFFNGEDLFENYAQWLVETVKKACDNSAVIWYVKVHPSNLWRGELDYYHDGKYEEVRLIEEHVGALPSHVRFIYPDTEISPFTWMQIADFGVTVRGTSGIELGALGKTVITAGSGRYESIGFTLNSSGIKEYLDLLSALPAISQPTERQTWLARRFAYATFCMKPFTLDFLNPIARTGRLSIFNSDDLVYLGKFEHKFVAQYQSIKNFTDWAISGDSIDFLNPWPAVRSEPAELILV